MNTREMLPAGTCVYCGGSATTADHAPPRCFLQPPRPSHLITLPSCQPCNNAFSRQENIVAAVVGIVGVHEHLVKEREPDGRLDRALRRDGRLRTLIDAARSSSGAIELSGELMAAFAAVLKKTARGLYFGLYQSIPADDACEVLRIVDQRHRTAEQVAEDMKPSPLRDVTDEPLPSLTADSWPLREPVFIVNLSPVGGGPPTQRMMRLVRETPIKWEHYQRGVFSVCFVRNERGNALCVMDIWSSLAAAVEMPWPGDRGPLRRGKKNPMSRDKPS